jgi:dihydrolipoamide dehydrogenase
MDKIMPGFDTEIARMAERLLIKGRPIDYHTGVIATKVTPGVPGALLLPGLAAACYAGSL